MNKQNLIPSQKLPQIIQGGMGVGVSNWRLANVVSRLGEIGVVSGTAIDAVVARRLQLGDTDGSIRRALSHFPWPKMAKRFLDNFFIPGGKAPHEPFKLMTLLSLGMKRARIEQMIVGNFVEVFLAKEGHRGIVGINYLEKIQLPTLPSMFGAMLAGVDIVLMGAGIPLAIPGTLDRLATWDPVELKIQVEDNTADQAFVHRLDPREYSSGVRPELSRPQFLAIVSSDVIAKTMIRRATGRVDGFVVEGHTAGGHNAPPRRVGQGSGATTTGYSDRDIPDIAKIKSLGRPFWLAGGFASPGKLKEALALGANGIQVGTVFAFCDESGIVPAMKEAVLKECINGTLTVTTDFKASPTGYPFKIVSLKNSRTSQSEPGRRERICDLGYLRELYCKDNSKVGYRCPSEPVKDYVAKGGREDSTTGRQCLCNGLVATIGLGQSRGDETELPLITAGDDFSFVEHLVKSENTHYSAREAIEYLKPAHS
ncbi:MAG: nitronate monooxygenase [Planctomycetes bacterium]|nr:nitronate monooxygenase [Planctomycetota bacterium]